MEVFESYCPQSYEKNKYDLKRLNALPVIPKTFPSILMALYSKAQSSVGVCGGVLGSGNGTSFSSFFVEQSTSLVDYTSLFCIDGNNSLTFPVKWKVWAFPLFLVAFSLFSGLGLYVVVYY